MKDAATVSPVGWRHPSVAVFFFGLAVGAASCTNANGPDLVDAGPPASSPPMASRVVPLDSRFVGAGNLGRSHIIDLAGSPDGTVFAWVEEDMTGTASVVEIDRSASEVKRFGVTTAAGEHPQEGSLHGFAVTDQAVWIGAKTTLFRVDRATEEVTSRQLPKGPGSAADAVEIISISASAPRGLVIGLRAAPALLTFSPVTNAFSQLRLPDVGDANSVAVLADGTIGVGMLNNKSHHPDTVAIFSPTDHVTLATAESILISAWGDGFLTSGVAATSVQRGGSTEAIDLGGSQTNERLRPAELSDGRVVMLSNDRGLLVLDPTARKVTGTMSLGTIECGLGEGSHTARLPSTAATLRQSLQCPASPEHLSAIGGDLLLDLGAKGLQRAPGPTI